MESQFESEDENQERGHCKEAHGQLQADAMRTEDAPKEAITGMDDNSPDDIRGTLQQDLNALVKEV